MFTEQRLSYQVANVAFWNSDFTIFSTQKISGFLFIAWPVLTLQA